MTAPDADVDLLRERYRDVRELDRQPEGIRYAAALPDGMPVVVLALARDLRARVRFPERFTATLERAAAVRHEALASPLAWGHESNGLLHCASARFDIEHVVPGAVSAADVAGMGVQLARALAAVHGAAMTHGRSPRVASRAHSDTGRSSMPSGCSTRSRRAASTLPMWRPHCPMRRT